MPDDTNKPLQNPTNQATVPAAPPPTPTEEVPFPIADLPPLSDAALPVENQVTANAPQTPGTPPPFDIPPVVTPLTKKKWSGGKIVGAVLGLLLLVGGVGAGLLLVRQNQEVREKASGVTSCTNQPQTVCETTPGCTWNPPTSNTCTGRWTPAEGLPRQCGFLNGNQSENCPHQDEGCVFTVGRATGSCSGTPTGETGGQCTGEFGECGSADSNSCCSGLVCDAQGGVSGFCRRPAGDDDTNPPPGDGGDDNNPPPSTGGGDPCRYVNDGNQVSLAGDCSQYTFRALVFECPFPLVNGRCEGDGAQITTDQAGARSVSIGTAPSCGSKQADLIVTSRPNDGLCPSGGAECTDELPGTPRVANFITRDTGQSCGGTTPTGSNPEGYHDAFSGNVTMAECRAGGWAADPDNRAQDLNIRVFAGTTQVATGTAGGFRDDLSPICTGGTCAYDISLVGKITANTNHVIKVQAQDPGNQQWFDLTQTPRTINCQQNQVIAASPSPGAGPVCGAVEAYDTSWNRLTSARLSTLRAGDRIRLTLKGTLTSGSFTKARFKVNQSAAVEVSAPTNLRPGTTDTFFYEYTIPAGTRSFQVGGAIYHSTQGWVPNIIN